MSSRGHRTLAAVLVVGTLLLVVGRWYLGSRLDDAQIVGEENRASEQQSCEPASPSGDSPGCGPTHDSMPPPFLPEEPGGAPGFSRYVFTRLEGEVVATVVEGPRDSRIRCQSQELPCSYLDLKALYDSGDEIPVELGMDRSQLALLVEQLDTVAEAISSYESLDAVCAAGYQAASAQIANMGIHMWNPTYGSDGVFDPARPEMFLFSWGSGEAPDFFEGARCEEGRWKGDSRYTIVGAVFTLSTELAGDFHPDGFAGSIDNWHVHYSQCVTAQSTGPLSRERCEAIGGHYQEKSTWMLHAYAAPGFDNQAGVFSMWNASVWPTIDPDLLAGPAQPEPGGEDVSDGPIAYLTIFDFQFDEIEVEPGTTVMFHNSDAVHHTVTAGHLGAPTGAFDSGDLSIGEVYSQSFQAEGEYEFYCKRHPYMRGRVTVK